MPLTHKERRAEQRHALFQRFLRGMRCGEFDYGGTRPQPGQVREHVWDRVCVPGYDEKDGQQTEFNLETLSEMVENFVERGDLIPLDFNHQSNYSHINGQPAPALAFYGALAIVAGGKVVKIGLARGESATGDEPGIDLSKDGLWAYRCQVTPLGQELLPNFLYVSPTFMSEGTRRDGTNVGYMLAAVAATNTPWQGDTQITFEREDTTATSDGKPTAVQMRIEQRGSEWVVLPESGDRVLGKHKTKADAEKQLAAIEAAKAAKHEGSAGTAPAQQEEAKMAKLSKYAKFAGAADGADDETIKQGLGERLGKLAQEAMSDEAFQYEEEAAKLEEMAEAFAGDAEMEEMGKKFSKMAARFHRMAKLDADGDDDGDKKKTTPCSSLPATQSCVGRSKMEDEEEKAKMAKLEGEKEEAKTAEMEALRATVKTLTGRLSTMEKREEAREAEARKAEEHRFEQLADDAIAGGYPKAKRSSLIKFARQDFEAARETVEAFLPKQGRAHLMDRLSANGGPVGRGRDTRHDDLAVKPREYKTPFGRFVEDDAAFAEKAREFAESKDPVIMDKIDRMLPAGHRPQMFHRLLAAQNVVRAEHPDLAEAAGE